MRAIIFAARFLTVAIAAGPALAQNKPLLDLTAAPSAPAAGSGAGTLALADQLNAEAKSLDQSSDAGARVRAELRRLARQLLIAGENAGPAGSARVVLGRTLATAIPTLDALANSGDAPTLLLATADLATAREAFESGSPDPDLVLRDGLVHLSTLAPAATGIAGWIDDRPSTPSTFNAEEWSRLPGVTPEAAAALKELDALAAQSEKWPAYKSSGARARAIVCDAAGAIESPPSWMPEQSRRLMGTEFSTALIRLMAADTRAQGLDSLSRMARLAELIRRTDALEDNAATRKIRAAVGQAVAISPAQADARTFDSFTRHLDLATARTRWPEEKSLLRQLRPGYRILTGAARPHEQAAFSALPEVLRRPEAMNEPGTLAAFNMLRRAVDDVQGLIDINLALSAPGSDPAAEPTPAPQYVKAAERILKLSQELSKPDQKEAALTSLRTLMMQVRMNWKLPGEDELRAAARADIGKPPAERKSVWAKLSGGREAALVSEITDRRTGWLNSWERGPVVGSDGDRLTALRVLLALMADAAPIFGDEAGYQSLQQWPGWELSWPTVTAISAGLPDQLAEASRLLLAGDSGKATEVAAKARAESAITLLAGRLAREAKARQLTPSPSIVQLTSGGPIRGRTWMGEWTSQLDDVCRYAEESTAVRKLGAKDKADAMLKFAGAQAVTVLDALDAARDIKAVEPRMK